MEKLRLFTMCLATLAFSLMAISANADEAKKDRLIYSLDTGIGITGDRGNVGTPLKQDYDVAIHIADEHFVGMQIAAVRVPIGEMKNISGLKVWLSKELTLQTIDGKKVNVPDVLSQDAEITSGWVEVPLQQPYTITSDGVYVGYSFTMDELDDTNKRPVRITTELHEGGLFLHTSRSYRSWTDVSDQCSSLLQVELDGAPMNAAAVLPGNTTYFGATGIQNQLTFYVENHGAKGVKNIEYAFTYDGKEHTGTYKFQQPLSSVYGVLSPFQMILPVVSKKDYYPVDIKITKVNGSDNEETAGTAQTTVSVFDKLPKHRAVVEEYTGTWCGFCPRGYVGLQAMNRLHPDDFIALSYHHAETSDDRDEPMQVMMGTNFPSTVNGFPAAWLDRTYQTDAYGGLDQASNSLGIDNLWQQVCSLLSEADINVKASLSDDKSTVTATATVEFPLEMKNAHYGVEYVLVADGLTGTGKGWEQHNYYYNGRQGKDFTEPEFKQFVEGKEYVSGLVFDDVVVATTRLTGDNQYMPETIAEGQSYDLSAAFSLDKVRNVNNDPVIQDVNKLRVVALLIDYNDNTIVNAAKTGYFAAADGITNVSASEANESAAVYDLSGRRLSSMQKGLNIVRTADGKTMKVMMK